MNNFYSIIRILERVSYWRVWLMIFTYSLIFGLFFQFFILPTIFFKMHAGNGLIIGGDWVGYHEIAKNLAYSINSEGWQLWELRPYGQSAAGIAAVIYALTVSKPFVLLPIYSAIMASSALILIRISEELVKNRFAAIVSIIPFVIFPSNIAIYDQIGKDAFYFLGAYFCLYSWILVFLNDNQKNKYLIAIIFMIIGSFLMWTVRNYSIIILKNMLYLLIVLNIILFIINLIRKNSISSQISGTIVLIISSIILSFYTLDKSDPRGSLEVNVGTSAEVGTSAQSSVKFSIPEASNVDWHGLVFARDNWKKSDWLPSKIDNALLNIAILRNGYIVDFTQRSQIYKNTGSMIDLEVHLTSALEFVKYAPRALQVAFLAPFPSDWVRDLKSAHGQRGMQGVIAAEMLFSYLFLLMFPIAIYSFWKNPFFYVTVFFSMIMLMLYAYATPNIGTLYRLRYGFIVPIISISLGCAVSKFINKYKIKVIN